MKNGGECWGEKGLKMGLEINNTFEITNERWKCRLGRGQKGVLLGKGIVIIFHSSIFGLKNKGNERAPLESGVKRR